jgi:hypothetical protein
MDTAKTFQHSGSTHNHIPYFIRVTAESIYRKLNTLDLNQLDLESFDNLIDKYYYAHVVSYAGIRGNPDLRMTPEIKSKIYDEIQKLIEANSTATATARVPASAIRQLPASAIRLMPASMLEHGRISTARSATTRRMPVLNDRITHPRVINRIIDASAKKIAPMYNRMNANQFKDYAKKAFLSNIAGQTYHFGPEVPGQAYAYFDANYDKVHPSMINAVEDIIESSFSTDAQKNLKNLGRVLAMGYTSAQRGYGPKEIPSAHIVEYFMPLLQCKAMSYGYIDPQTTPKKHDFLANLLVELRQMLQFYHAKFIGGKRSRTRKHRTKRN